MKYVIQAIQALHENWQGAVHFDAGGNVSAVYPNEGHPMPDMELVAMMEEDMAPRLDILARLGQLDLVVNREREDTMKILHATPQQGDIADAITEKVQLRTELQNLSANNS